ncbi:MAG: hypothetical protein EHM36_02620, partial [Deltaproteobacteria bacterium]
EFAGMLGDLKWNPVIKIETITHRRDPIFYALMMPWENAWLGGPVSEALAWQVLRAAGLDVRAVRVTEGSACRWSVIASIRKQAGEGKNALMALLALPEVKQATVTDDDVNIFDQTELDRAVTFRVQADKDILVISGAKAKHVDPSVRPWDLPKGGLPLTAKFGIDATIPEGIPYRFYKMVKPPFFPEAQGPKGAPSGQVLREKICSFLREHRLSFDELMGRLSEHPYREVVKVWGDLRAEKLLCRDKEGKYFMNKDS